MGDMADWTTVSGKRSRRERICRFCAWCDKAMRRAQRIEIGWSVMTGRLAVCSEQCRLAYNTNGRSLAVVARVALRGEGEKSDPYDPSGFREAELRGKNVRKNKAKFDVAGVHIDGKSGGSLIIEAPKANGTVLVTFRPKFSRRDYTLTLSEVCEMIAWRAAKKEA